MLAGVLGASAAAGRFVPTKPSLSWTGLGQVTISPFDANLSYNVTVNSGSVTRSGAVVTLSSRNAVATITASSPKGGSSPQSTFERREYTFTTVVTGPAPILDSFETSSFSCPSGYNFEDYGAQGRFCRLYGPAPTTQVKNSTPSGFSDQYGEWGRVT